MAKLIKEQLGNEYAKEHGTDQLAINGYYSGKILKITDKGAYQQTREGVVLHPICVNTKDLELNKSYNLGYREIDKGHILKSETYEVKLPDKNQNRDRGR